MAEIAAELNVGAVAPVSGTAGSLVNTTAKANFRTLGKRFGKAVQGVAAAVAAADAVALSDALRATGSASVTVDGAEVTLGPDEVVVTETPRQGWAVAAEAGATVALDLQITPELRRAGIARDAIRQIQEARKSSGLEVADRIVLRYRGHRRRHRDRPRGALGAGRGRGAGHRLSPRASRPGPAPRRSPMRPSVSDSGSRAR